MNHLITFLVFLFSASTILAQPLSAQNAPIQFTQEEKEFIVQHLMVTMSVDPVWYPFEQINTEGEYIGVINQSTERDEWLIFTYNYRLIAMLILAIIVVVVLGLLWNNQLRRFNARLEEKQNKLLSLFREQSKDITYRKEIEQQLRSHQQQLSGMISTLPGFVYRCINDEQYTMHFISDGCEEITGYKPLDFIDNRTLAFATIIHPDDVELIRNTWDEALQQKTHFQLEFRIIHRNGSIRIIRERGHGIFSDDLSRWLYQRHHPAKKNGRSHPLQKPDTTTFGSPFYRFHFC